FSIQGLARSGAALTPAAGIDYFLIRRQRGAAQAFGGEAALGLVGNSVDREKRASCPRREIKQGPERDGLELRRAAVLDRRGRTKPRYRTFVEMGGNSSVGHCRSFSF